MDFLNFGRFISLAKQKTVTTFVDVNQILSFAFQKEKFNESDRKALFVKGIEWIDKETIEIELNWKTQTLTHSGF